MTGPTTIRDVMVSNLLDHPSATMPALIEFGSEVPDDVTDAYAIVDRIIADERLHVALSTPPADDVREALALTIAKSFPGWSEDTSEPLHVGWSEALRLHAEQHNQRVNEECIRQGRAYADAVLAAFEVRPHGTVTDAEVDAALDAYLDGAEPLDWQPGAMRAALEAAREVHP